MRAGLNRCTDSGEARRTSVGIDNKVLTQPPSKNQIWHKAKAVCAAKFVKLRGWQKLFFHGAAR